MQDQSSRVTAYLSTLFEAHEAVPTLFASMRYSLLAPGKRLRPILCLATARTYDIDEEVAMPVAAALECIHAYSLIHDDLPAMDNDDLRRGLPTNHKVYGEATALLAGDALLTYAFELVAKPLPLSADRQLKMIQLLAHQAGCYGMIAGQAADMQAQGQNGTLNELQFIHVHKTARLIQCSIEMGALFAELDESERKSLASYGYHLGLAFQIVDDLLDVTGSTEELGKNVGMDEQMHKLTYPALLGIEKTKEILHQLEQQAYSDLQQLSRPAPLLADMIQLVVRRQK